MSSTRFEPSSIRNKIKREEVSRKTKKAKGQQKLQKRLAQAKTEANDPAAKKEENAQDLAADPFSAYFSSTNDPTVPPKILITTSPKATKATYDFCDELVGVFPGAEFIRRKKGKGFEVGRIAGWAAGRGYKHMCVVNEDSKKPNAITLIHLPDGPTAYFRLTSVEAHARATPHDPELVLNNFVTRLGHAVGRMFQTLFPPLPEFQGRQVVTLHNQRDFLFFRRHRYAFRSPEKVALQEIGPRFTLRLRSLRKGIPAVQRFGEQPKPLVFEVGSQEEDDAEEGTLEEGAVPQTNGAVEGDTPKLDAPAPKPMVPPTTDEYLWEWKPELETTRKTFFLQISCIVLDNAFFPFARMDLCTLIPYPLAAVTPP
ncbi:anticodon-binding protein [Mycena polygramma]|nr:anticodon-binding protein [Mycena polygramma]